ncbi:MAG: phosphoadenylyl-sulfate reductase [Ferruginibacter sp.]
MLVNDNTITAENLLKQIDGLAAPQALSQLMDVFKETAVFSTSFSYEDQAITHLIASQQLPIDIFTLDTGRLFAETYSVWNSTIEKYPIKITAYYPDALALQDWIKENGPNAFYNSVEQRKACCAIRKVVPLKRALEGKKLWITGLRAAHSPGRENLPIIEWDADNQLFKYHPLLHWSTETLIQFIREHQIPYNPLHEKGFISIGCAPCTRAIKEGEDFRAGRWWWEDASKKECGLHVHTPTSA